MRTKFPISHLLKFEINERKNEENVWGPEASLSLSSHGDFAPSVAGLFCKNDIVCSLISTPLFMFKLLSVDLGPFSPDCSLCMMSYCCSQKYFNKT